MGNADSSDVTDRLGLDGLVLLLLVADAPIHVRLADNGTLHRAVVDAHQKGRLAGVVHALGHRPDPMIGRRVTGLDQALRVLVDSGHLVEASAARWRITNLAAAAARRRLAAFPFEHRRAVGELAASWRHLVRLDAERREPGMHQASSV